MPIRRPEVISSQADGVRFAGPYYMLPNIGRAPSAFPGETISPELTLTRLSDVTCLPGQIALHRPHAGAPPALLMESLSSEWHRHGVYLDKRGDDAFALREDLREAEYLPGRHLYLDNMHSPHFGHFLADVLSMVWGYDAARRLGVGELGVLIERHEAPYIVPLLEACGIPARAIRRVVAPVRCEEVLFAKRSFLVQGYTTPVAAATWTRIRDALDAGQGPDKVYVSRARVPNRRLLDEEAVEAVFRQRGFFIAHPQEMTIGQQVTLWANARTVAGSAGSNMFGLAFQRRLRRCLLINSPNMVQFQELFLQAGHGSETSLYLGTAEGDEVHAPWRVAPGDLARRVDAWLAETGAAPMVKKRLPARRQADDLALFDEDFYLERYPDVRESVRRGELPSGRQHFETIGFVEQRQAFRFDQIWYAASYPEVVREIGQGNFVDAAHHYAAIGHLAGCQPVGPPRQAAALRNLGRGKRATQSSVSQWSKGTAEQDAAGALNGHADGGYHFHTGFETDPWWQADLGEVASIAEIRIFNRLEPAARDRFMRFKISIGAEPGALVELFRKDDDVPIGGADGKPFVWKPGRPATGRFIRITTIGTTCLHLDQVEVLGP